MLNHEDPLRHIYVRLSKNDPDQNHVPTEREFGNLIFKTGYHVYPTELRLTNGEVVEALVYFTAQYHSDHYENIGDRGSALVSKGHWETIIQNIATPEGNDLTSQVPQQEFRWLED